MKPNVYKNLWRRAKQFALSAVTLIAGSVFTHAQVSSYPFTQTSGTYAAVTGGTLIGQATDANPGGTPESAPMDDFTYTAPLPFSFNFNGQVFDTVRINTNGWISFGTAVSGTLTTPISSTTGFGGVICPFGHDLMGIYATSGITTTGSTTITNVANTSRCKVGAAIQGAGIQAATTIASFTANSITLSAAATATVTSGIYISFAMGEIRMVTSGTAPNRTAIIQFSGMAKYSSSLDAATNNNAIDFQIRLSESTNIISVVYGSMLMSGTGSYTSQVGLRGAAATDYNNRTSTTSWSASTAGTSNSATMTWSSAILPASGQTYTWTPATCMAPVAVTLSAITAYTATASWTAPTPVPANGYEYYVSTSSTAPTTATVASGTIPAGATTALIPGLVSGTLHYLWIRSICSGTDKSGWSNVASFTTLVTCGVPTAVTVPVATVTTTAAVINWTAPTIGPPVNYQYEVRTSGAAGSGPTGLVASGSPTGTTANPTTLSPATAYSVYVRANCGTTNGNSTWTAATTFTTLCNTSVLPFLQGFNGGSLPPCWATFNGAANTNANSFWKFAGAPDYGAAPAINGRTTGTYAWVDGSDPSTISDVTLTSPVVNLTGLTNPALSFDYFSNNTNTYPNNIFKVDVNNGSGWVNIFTDNTSLPTWRANVIPLPAGFANTNTQIRFVVDKTPPAVGFAFYNDILLDSVVFVEAPTCNPPTAVATNTLTPTSANISWAAPAVVAPAGYQWEIRTSALPGSGPTGLTASGNTTAPVVTASVSTLVANTTYSVYVRSQCGATTFSTWSNALTFTTPCAVFPTPFLETFEGATFVPGCWQQATGLRAAPTVFTATNNYWNQQNYSDASVTTPTNKSARINIYGTARKDWLMTPSVNLGTTPKQLEFDLSLTEYYDDIAGVLGADDTFAVVISTDNGVTWTRTNTLRQWNSTTAIPNGAGEHITINLSAYTGVVKIGFYGESTVSNADVDLFVDNVSISSLCPVVNLGPDVTACNTAAFSQTLNAGNAGATYVWDNASTAQTRTVTAAGTYYVAVTIGTCTRRDTVVVSLNALPVVNLGNDTAICSGNTLTMSAGNPGAGYLWDNATTAQTRTVSASGTYYVAVTGTNTCVGRDTLVVTVNALPVVSLGNDTGFCTGGSLVLDASATGAAYLWDDASTAATRTVTAAGTYYVAVTATNTCTGRDTIAVVENALPVVSLGNDTAICGGVTLTLDAANAGAAYLWDDASTAQTRDINTAGAYAVSVTDANGCSAADTVTVTQIAAPSGTIQSVNNGEGSYTFSVGNPANVTVSNWNYGDQSTGTGSPVNHTYAANGDYVVTLTLVGQCDDTITTTQALKVDGITHINKLVLGADELMLFPNPARSVINITNKSGLRMQTVTAFNILGQQVYHANANSAQNHQMNISSLASGVYTLKITTEKGSVIRKFEVMK